MKQVLAILGSNFLGHITNVYPILDFFKKQNFHIKVIVLPITTVSNPPIVKFLEEKDIEYSHYNTFEDNSNSPKNIFSYYDLLYQLGFNDIAKLNNYYHFIDDHLDNNTSLVLSDFTFFTGNICNKKGIPFVSIRSHALKVSFLDGKKIELFNWWDNIPEENVRMIYDMQNNLMKVGKLSEPNQAFYADTTITPGFYPFDDSFPNYTNHYFLINRKRVEIELPNKEVYIYVRDKKILDHIIKLLKQEKRSYWVVDTKLDNEFIDLWEAIPKASTIISHGGHGLCLWAIYNKIFHIVIPDNNDRLSNAKRVMKLGFGKYTTYTNFLKHKKYCFYYSEYDYTAANLIQTSSSFEDFSKLLLNRILNNEKTES
jgi:hypothetical protein